MTAFAPGSVSLRLYPHDLEPHEMLVEMERQASQAVEVGFDGIMVSERHGGIVGNVPNALQVTGWLAGAMGRGWVAPCPVLALFRPPALIVEEVAWLAARYPGRVGVGLGTGGNDLDFRLYGVERAQLAERFEPVLRFVTGHLSGAVVSDLSRDHAVARCRDRPVPVISAAMSAVAVRRAARCGAGVIGSSMLSVDQERKLGEAYRQAGGSGPEVLLRFVWLGDLPDGPVATKYREYARTSSTSAGGDGAPAGSHQASGQRAIIASRDPAEIAERLCDALKHSGRTCLHLRVHVPGIPPAMAREQIDALGGEVLPRLRSALVGSGE